MTTWVFHGVSKNSGKKPKMACETNGSKPYFLMDDLGEFI